VQANVAYLHQKYQTQKQVALVAIQLDSSKT